MILITGSSGMLGRAAMNYYPSAIGLDIIESEKTIKIDLIEFDAVKKIFEEYRPEYILHCAALVSVEECEKDRNKAVKINYDVTKNIATLCREYDTKMIYISTNMVFDGTKETPYSESDFPNPLNTYSLSKYLGELAVMRRSVNPLIIRTNIIGRTGYWEWLNVAMKGAEITLYKNIKFNCMSVEDLVKYVDMIKQKSGIYNVTSRDSVSKLDFGEIIKRKMKYPAKINAVDYEGKIDRPLNAVLDCSKIEIELGILMPTVNETIEKMIGGGNG